MTELVTVAIVGAIQAIGAIVVNARMTAWTDAQKLERTQLAEEQKAAREELARKVEEHNAKIDQHNASIARKLDVNTEITVATEMAAKAFNGSAEHFNERLAAMEKEIQESILAELQRMSLNLHEMRNKLTIIVGQIPWTDRKPEDDAKP